MEITLTLSSNDNEHLGTETINVKPEATLSSIQLLPDFSVYYPVNQPHAYCGRLPFIINSGRKISWDMPLEKVTVSDFLRTHSIDNHQIMRVPYGAKVLKLHKSPVLNSVNSITGELGFNITCHAIYKNIIKETGALPFSVIDYILSKTSWDPQALAQSISYPQNRIEILLKGLGYETKGTESLFITQPDKLQVLKQQLTETHQTMA